MIPAAYFAVAACQKEEFFLLPAWWKYLEVNTSNCTIIFHVPGDIWLVALAILDILLRVAGMVAVVMIIVAGFRYITASGNTDKAVSARKTALNSVIGLIIAIIASSVVAFLGNSIGGPKRLFCK
jgi:hypothetical protein